MIAITFPSYGDGCKMLDNGKLRLKGVGAVKIKLHRPVGLTAFATLSDGTEIENPRYYKEAQVKFRRAQRKVARRKRGGNNQKKAVRGLQRAHAHVANQRADFAHKVARALVPRDHASALEILRLGLSL